MIIGAVVGAVTAALLTPVFYDTLNSAGINASNAINQSPRTETLFAIANATWYMVLIALFAGVAKQVSA